MASAVIVAIIGAMASLIGALLSAKFATTRDKRSRQTTQESAHQQGKLQKELAVLTSELQHEAKAKERADTANAELDRYREPLLRAALDLAHRLNNIRNQGFFEAYLTAGDSHRREVARSSTLYRFARYWCIVENLYDNVALLRFEEDEVTRPVAGTLNEVGRTFATDNHGPIFMV